MTIYFEECVTVEGTVTVIFFCAPKVVEYSFFCFDTFAVDFVLKDPREKDEDKKEEVLEHRLE